MLSKLYLTHNLQDGVVMAGGARVRGGRELSVPRVRVTEGERRWKGGK